MKKGMHHIFRWIVLSILILISACTNQDISSTDSVPDVTEIEVDDRENEVQDNSVPDDRFLPQDPSVQRKEWQTTSLIDDQELTITAQIISTNIQDNDVIMYGYNGQIPGPTLRVMKGSSVKINFVNEIDWDTTVHWHGLRHDVKDDGVPGISQPPVKPGESFEYTLRFPDAGVFWYHPHVREDIQQDLGLYGTIIVEPSGNYYNEVHREEILVFDDILMNENGLVPYGKEHATHVIMGRFGNIMLTNGREDYQLSVTHNEIVRFFVSNVANVRPLKLRFDGAQMKLVGGDLGKFEREEFVDAVIIAPAERVIIEVFFDEQGVVELINDNPMETHILGSILVEEGEIIPDRSEDFPNLHANNDIIDDIDQFREYFDKDPDIQLELDIDMDMKGMEDMVIDEHHIDGIEWEDNMGPMNSLSTSEMLTWLIKDKESDLSNEDLDLRAKVGDKVLMRINNPDDSMHPMQHPIHLHGQRFLIIRRDGVDTDNLVWKDTVLIPIGQTVDLLIDVTNPGEWMMHCHIAEHLESGMMTSFTVEP